MKIYLVASGRKTPPDAPTSLTATAVSASRIDLSWTNNATSYDGTKIERSTDGVNFTEITDVASGVSTYASTGLSASTQYYYRVRAYKGTLNSAYSNTADATTSPALAERIIEIDTTKTETGSSASNQFRLVSIGARNYTVDWGDGIVETNTTQSVLTHTYAVGGVYDIKITGMITHNVDNVANQDRRKYTKIKQWGSVISATGLNSWTDAFYGCTNLVLTATDAPDLTGVTSLQRAFSICTSLGSPDMSSWDTSGIDNMSNLFNGCSNFNGNVTNWDVSNVTTFDSMFSGCSVFNQDISSWDVSSATTLASMFRNANVFNQDVSGWDVSNVTSLSNTFAYTQQFNQPIGVWNTSNVTTMSACFQSAQAFRADISSWNVGKVTFFSSMFSSCFYDKDLSSWNIGQNLSSTATISMNGMFANSGYSFDLSSWDMTRVVDISLMFRSGPRYSFGPWDIRQVTTAGNFMNSATTMGANTAQSALNLADTYISWSQLPVVPLTISFNTVKYDASGASARAILTATRAVSVTGAGDPLADGTYTWNGSRYENANGYYFSTILVVTQFQWRVHNSLGTVLATGNSSFPSQNTANPASSSGWSGAWSGMVITMTGAGWTISDGGQL